MDPEEMLAELERLAQRLGMTVRYEATGGRVGRCLLRGEPVILVEARLPLRDKVEGLALALADLDYSALFVPEAVRDLLESKRSGRGNS